MEFFLLLSRPYSRIQIVLIKLLRTTGAEWADLQTFQIFLTKLPLEKRTALIVHFFDVHPFCGVCCLIWSPRLDGICALLQSSSDASKCGILSIAS